MSDRPVLVKESWAKKVDDAVFSSNGASKRDVSTLFYDVRPAVLASAWSQNAAGLWTATAKFLVNDAVDSSFTFPVCAPASTSSPGGTVDSTRFYVVWRGRWEMLAGAGGGMTPADVDARINLKMQSVSISYVESVSILNGVLTFTSNTATVYVPR